MLRNIVKFSAGGLVLAGLAVGAVSGVQYLKYRYSDEYKAQKELKKLVYEYENDPYGGDTPEETLRLFIDALKKGDVDLAAKYFVMERQKDIKSYLFKTKEDNLLNPMIIDLEKTKLTISIERAFFSLLDKNNKVISELVMKTHPVNKKWKIEEL